MIRTVITEKGEITYCLERKSVKNLNLRVRGDGSIYLSVPKRLAAQTADEFVKNHINFILKHLKSINENNSESSSQQYFLGEKIEREIKQGEKPFAQLSDKVLTVYLPYSASENSEEERERLIEEITVCWEKEKGKELFPQYLDKAYQRFQRAGLSIPYPTISVKAMKSRWGSCTPYKKKITLNCSLTEKPPICIEYVICHELAHFLQQNHSEKFYAVLDKVMPGHKELKKVLNNRQQ